MAYVAPTGNAITIELDSVVGAGYVGPLGSTLEFVMTAVEEPHIYEGLSFSADAVRSPNFSLALVDGLGLSDLTKTYFEALLADGLALSELLGASAAIIASTIDAIALSENLIGSKTVVSPVVELLSLRDSGASTIVGVVAVTDTLTFLHSLADSGALYGAWVANLVNKAHSRYENFQFNSFATVDGKLYGATDSGVHELSGIRDGEQDIRWTLTLPKTDFGSDQIKSITQVYLGAKGNGEVILKVVTDKGEVHHYQATPRSDLLETSRFTPGKGIKERYWAFELTSSSTKEIESISFLPVVFDRRI